jgi:hypothetical protein
MMLHYREAPPYACGRQGRGALHCLSGEASVLIVKVKGKVVKIPSSLLENTVFTLFTFFIPFCSVKIIYIIYLQLSRRGSI